MCSQTQPCNLTPQHAHAKQSTNLVKGNVVPHEPLTAGPSGQQEITTAAESSFMPQISQRQHTFPMGGAPRSLQPNYHDASRFGSKPAKQYVPFEYREGYYICYLLPSSCKSTSLPSSLGRLSKTAHYPTILKVLRLCGTLGFLAPRKASHVQQCTGVLLRTYDVRLRDI